MTNFAPEVTLWMTNGHSYVTDLDLDWTKVVGRPDVIVMLPATLDRKAVLINPQQIASVDL